MAGGIPHGRNFIESVTFEAMLGVVDRFNLRDPDRCANECPSRFQHNLVRVNDADFSLL